MFFLNDSQFIELISKIQAQDDFSDYVNELFPGAIEFFFKKSVEDVVLPPEVINDISVLQQEELSPDYIPHVEFKQMKRG